MQWIYGQRKASLLFTIAIALICGALGAAGGAEYVMRRVDEIDAARAVEQKKADAAKTDTIARFTQTAVDLNRQLYSCQVQFQASTVLYESAPGLNLSLGVHGLGLAPSANQAPKWVIPARVKPLVISNNGAGTQGAVYYYISQDNRLDGPYIPQVAAQQ